MRFRRGHEARARKVRWQLSEEALSTCLCTKEWPSEHTVNRQLSIGQEEGVLTGMWPRWHLVMGRHPPQMWESIFFLSFPAYSIRSRWKPAVFQGAVLWSIYFGVLVTCNGMFCVGKRVIRLKSRLASTPCLHHNGREIKEDAGMCKRLSTWSGLAL